MDGPSSPTAPRDVVFATVTFVSTALYVLLTLHAGYTMATIPHDGAQAPEVAPQNFPEVTPYEGSQHGSPPHEFQQPYQQSYQQDYQQPYGQGYQQVHQSPQTVKTELSTAYGQAVPSYRGQVVTSPYDQAGVTDPPKRDGGRASLFCGCGLLVFVLSCVIAILSAAVIGLAAGTGVEANRANQATANFAALNSSVAAGAVTATVTTTVTATTTGAAAAATTTAFNSIDDGCSNNPFSTNGTIYTAFKLLGGANFTIYCNLDTGGSPLYSMFTADMDSCMDACSAWSKYTPGYFGTDTNNTKCGAISFIPLWTTKANASSGYAPGNCYLKAQPQNITSLYTDDIGTEVHAAIVL